MECSNSNEIRVAAGLGSQLGLGQWRACRHQPPRQSGASERSGNWLVTMSLAMLDTAVNALLPLHHLEAGGVHTTVAAALRQLSGCALPRVRRLGARHLAPPPVVAQVNHNSDQ